MLKVFFMQNTIVQNQLKLFQKLYSTLPKIKIIKENGEFKNEVNTIYYHKKRSFWFTKAEKGNKFYYFFGLKNSNNLSLDSASLVIDTSMDEEFNSDSIGTLINMLGNVKLLLNENVLSERYPNLDTTNFKSFYHKDSTRYIDLGFIEGDFIDNLEKLVQKSAQITHKVNTKPKKVVKNPCEICSREITRIKSDPEIENLKKHRSNLCGECIEKILACEFFQKIDKILDNSKTKTLLSEKEKFGNDDVFDYSIKILEKYDIIKFIGVKKLFFTVDKNHSLIKQYSAYIDEENLLIDELFSYNDKQIQMQMNLFINSLNAGKSHSEAYKIAKIDEDKVSGWFKLGQSGDENYSDFYNSYLKFFNTSKELELISDLIKKERNLKRAIHLSDITFNRAKELYNLGSQGHEDFADFYNLCEKYVPYEFLDEEELISKFLELREDGKTTLQAVKTLKISKQQIDKWLKKAKNGSKLYKDFDKFYLLKEEVYECKICGRKLNKKSTKKICKRCEKKQFAGKILSKLLDYIEPGKIFKKEDLKALNLQDIQITEYLWTLKEFNLVLEKNANYKLKSRKNLEEFVKNSGLNPSILPKESKNNIYKTCIKCGKSLKKSRFSKGDKICKDCRKLEKTVDYLKEIMEYVQYGEKFVEEDLSKHFDNPLNLQAKIWLLADNDLITRDFNDNSYTLASENKIREFLAKNGDTNSKIIPDMNRVLDEINRGKSRTEASKITNVPVSLINEWYEDGKNNKNQHSVNFYNTIKSHENKKVSFEAEEFIDKSRYPNYSATVDNMNIVIDGLNNDLTPEDAVKNADIKFDTYKYWFNRGKQGFGNIYIDFYNIVDDILSKPKNKEEIQDEGILTLIPPDIEKKLLRRSRGNQTGFAWVNKVGNYYKYGRTIDKEFVVIQDKTIEGLYEKVKDKGLLWGVRDLDKARSIVGEDDALIYAPLDEKYLKSFPSKTNSTGIAWVNKVGNRFIYSRTEGESHIKLTDSDIISLFKQVKSHRQPWGIRDYSKAYEFIDIPKGIADKNQIVEKDNYPKTGIFKPLSDSYSFSSKNATGIAWVNKIGNRYIYARQVNGEMIRFVDDDIVKLYNKVISQNQVWGIRDYKKASTIIPQETVKDVGKKDDIYQLLDNKYSDYSQITNTGLAFVDKDGDRFIYSLKRGKKIIRLTDSDINNLHKKVLDNDGIWGVVDLKKAQRIIDPDTYGKIEKIGNVSVNYIEKSKSKLSVIINGTIKNNQLFLILKKLEVYELDFKRMITTSMNNKIDLFIEIEIQKNTKNVFEDKIKDLGWK